MTETVAVFDLDGTLTRRDTTVAFCLSAVPRARLWTGILRSSPRLAAHRLGLEPNWMAKEALLTAFFAGAAEGELREHATGWAVDVLPRLVRRAGLERLRWHQREGHRVVIASASLELFVAPWARSVGVDDALGTRLEVRDGVLTGRIAGRNCYGPEKLTRVRALVGVMDGVELYAYGDSRGDRELLAAAHHACYRPFR